MYANVTKLWKGWPVSCPLLLAVLLAAPGAWADDAGGDATSPVARQAAGDAATAEKTEGGEGEQEVTTGMALLRKLKQGGWTIVALLLLSVFAVASTIERAIRLRRSVIVPGGIADRADQWWQAGDYARIASLRTSHPSTLSEILAGLVRHRRSSTFDLNTIAGDIASRDLRRHIGKAYPLAVVATLAPLLGLLGTIVGMIGAFDKVHAAGTLGDAGMLGGDISKALITTGVGLGVAVPALALYHFFKSRTTLLGLILEEEVSEIISAWFMETDDDHDGDPSPSSSPSPREAADVSATPADAKAPTNASASNTPVGGPDNKETPDASGHQPGQ